MRQWPPLGQILHGAGHALEGKSEARQQDGREQRKEPELHGLELGRGDGGDDQAERERCGNEQAGTHVQIQEAPVDWHVEQQHAQEQDQRGLDQAHSHEGQELADHEFRRCARRNSWSASSCPSWEWAWSRPRWSCSWACCCSTCQSTGASWICTWVPACSLPQRSRSAWSSPPSPRPSSRPCSSGSLRCSLPSCCRASLFPSRACPAPCSIWPMRCH